MNGWKANTTDPQWTIYPQSGAPVNHR